MKKLIILGPKTAILGPQICRILALGPHFWWSGGGLGPLDLPLPYGPELIWHFATQLIQHNLSLVAHMLKHVMPQRCKEKWVLRKCM